jgi:hypothetical protein
VPVFKGVRDNGGVDSGDDNCVEKHGFELEGDRFLPEPVPDPEHFIHGQQPPLHLIGKMVREVEVRAQVPRFVAEQLVGNNSLVSGNGSANARRPVPLNVYLAHRFIYIL